jgi:hypothetical protein
MNSNRSAALALALGSLGGLITMAFHPTGRDVLHNVNAGQSNLLSEAIHLLALLAQPVILAGTLGIAVRLRRRDLAAAGVAFYWLAAVASILAAAASGFIAPATIADYAQSDPQKQAMLLNMFHYTGLLNATFARMYALFAGSAILLWSIGMAGGLEFSLGLAVFGGVFGGLLVAVTASGQLHLDVHGFGAVVLLQTVWMVWTAKELWHARET